MTALKALLEKTKVESFIPKVVGVRDVVVVKSDASVAESFRTLLDNDVLSAPVFEAETSSYVGFLDLRDLASWIVFLFDEQETPSSDELDLMNAAPKFFKQFTGGISIKYLSKRNAFHAVSEGSSLAEVASFLRLGVKRVPVLNFDGRVINIISQTAVNRFLFENNRALKGDTSLPLSTLRIGKSPILSVRQDTPAIEAFRLMDNKHISGVAIVDSAGKIIDNTSSRDLKHFVKNPKRSFLLLPISEFLSVVREQCPESPVVTCQENETLAVAMRKIAATKVHRIYVLDSKGFPQRVITLTDIMKYIA